MHTGHPTRGTRAAIGRRTRAAAVAVCLAVVTTLSAGQAPPGDDPLPLRRVVLPPEQLAAELGRVKQGALVKLTRDDFEGRVKRAAAALATPERTPRLTHVEYTAELVGEHLTQGRAKWGVQSPAPDVVLPV